VPAVPTPSARVFAQQEHPLNDLSFLNDIPDPMAGAPAHTPGSAVPPRPTVASPTRDATHRRRAAALAVSLAWLASHLAVYGIRTDFHQLPLDYVVAQVALPFAFGGASLLVAAAPGRVGLGLGIGIIASLALLGPLSFWLFAAAMAPPYDAVRGDGFWLGSLVCLDITLAWAAAPLLLAALALRRAFPAGAAWRSALVGSALGLLSGAAINLHCSNVDPAHLLAGHGVPVVVAALLGAFVVARWTRI
jgi:hypothetical protein